jgi:hypothetical protein
LSRSIDIGVFQAMVDTWGPDFYQKTVICGASAGTMMALAIANGRTPEYMHRLFVSIAEKAKLRGSFFCGSQLMEEALREIISMDDPLSLSFERVRERCYIASTSFFACHRWHSSWKSNEDLLESAKASGHIPFYCQRNDGLDGSLFVVDGAYGVGGVHLPHGDETLFVGIHPFAEITRNATLSQLLFCPYDSDYEEIVRSGYLAFMRWNGERKKKLGVYHPNYTALCLLWILKFLEILFYSVLSCIAWVKPSLYCIGSRIVSSSSPIFFRFRRIDESSDKYYDDDNCVSQRKDFQKRRFDDALRGEMEQILL